jgi:hypothetical protein
MRTARQYTSGAFVRRTKRAFQVRIRLVALVLIVAVFICWSGSSRSAQAQGDPTQPSLTFLGDPLTLQLKEGEDEVSARVIVRNGSGRSLRLEFSAVMRDSMGEV